MAENTIKNEGKWIELYREHDTTLPNGRSVIMRNFLGLSAKLNSPHSKKDRVLFLKDVKSGIIKEFTGKKATERLATIEQNITGIDYSRLLSDVW